MFSESTGLEKANNQTVTQNMKIKKYIQILALLTFVPFMFASCSEDKTDAAKADIEQSSAKPYPFDTCIVSGKNLGSMGGVYAFVHEDQVIKMCCKKCLPKFNKNPEKYLSKLKRGKGSESDHDQTDHSGHNH